MPKTLFRFGSEFSTSGSQYVIATTYEEAAEIYMEQKTMKMEAEGLFDEDGSLKKPPRIPEEVQIIPPSRFHHRLNL